MEEGTHVDYILCNLKEMGDWKTAGENEAKQHWTIVYRTTLEIKNFRGELWQKDSSNGLQ